LSVRSAENIFKKAKRKVGIHKKISFADLRFSFSDHLAQEGMYLFEQKVKTIPGVPNHRATKHYISFTKNNSLKIKNFLDNIIVFDI